MHFFHFQTKLHLNLIRFKFTNDLRILLGSKPENLQLRLSKRFGNRKKMCAPFKFSPTIMSAASYMRRCSDFQVLTNIYEHLHRMLVLDFNRAGVPPVNVEQL